MQSTADVIVVGGGPVGAAVARELAVSGRRVVIIQRESGTGEAWRAAAGMLAPQIEADPEDPLFELGLAARERYAILAPELAETTGLSIGLWLGGILHLASAETATELRSRVALQRQHGHLADWLSAEEVHEGWPWLARSQGALWAPHDGALDPRALVTALIKDAERHGARVVHDAIVALERANGRVTGVRGTQHHSADDVVIAAGAWSGRIAGMPRPLSIEPVRGQMAAFAWPADVPPSIVYHGDGYLLHRDGEALAGSTMEFAGFNPETTEEGLAHVRSTVQAIWPALGTAPFIRTWAGLRPVSPDGLPIIGAEPRVEGLWYATGHGRNGILLAGITGVMVRELLDGDATREELAIVRSDRFWRW